MQQLMKGTKNPCLSEVDTNFICSCNFMVIAPEGLSLSLFHMSSSAVMS